MTREEQHERAKIRKYLVYLFIVKTMIERGAPPTIREIVAAGYTKSTSHASILLHSMEKDGAIKYSGHRYFVCGGQWFPPMAFFYHLTESMISDLKKVGGL